MGLRFIVLAALLFSLAALCIGSLADDGHVARYDLSNVSEPGSLGGQTIGLAAQNETGQVIGSSNKTLTFEMFPGNLYNGEARTICYGNPSNGIYNERPDVVADTVFLKITNLPVGGQMINLVGRAHE